MTTIGHVGSVHRYAVKSMQGEAPDAVEIGTDGIRDDRQWALRDTESGKLVSAKRPRLWRAALDCTATGTGDDVTVTLPDGESYNVGDPDLTDALGALFDRPVTMERSTHAQQGVYESDWPEIEGLTLAGEIDFPTNLFGEGTSFVDVGILHVLTTSSLAALASAAPDADLDVRRFRPSIVFDTGDAGGFAENDWAGRAVRVGDVELVLGEPTPRCVMTTVAQAGLDQDKDILQAIARDNRLTNELGSYACLGCYATVTRPGTIRVGDEITAL